jgi:hypothetical protein
MNTKKFVILPQPPPPKERPLHWNVPGGYFKDIALWELLNLYRENTLFLRDIKQIPNHEILQFTFQDLHKKGSIFDMLTDKLVEIWLDCPIDIKTNVEEIAFKWGLRSKWGCGLVLSHCIQYYDSFFLVSPGPPNSETNISIPISIIDSKKDIREKITQGKHEVKEYQMKVQKHLDRIKYLGYSSHREPDLIKEVQWLFWHVTPPYLDSEEIAERAGGYDNYYIERCYRNIAKVLGFEMKKGWQRGRRRSGGRMIREFYISSRLEMPK